MASPLTNGAAAAPGARPTAGSRGLSYQAVAGGANGLGAVGTPIPALTPSGLTAPAPDGDEVVDWPQTAAAVAPPTKSARSSLAPEPSHPGLVRSNSFTSPLDLRRAAQNGLGSRSSPSINPHLGTIGSPRTPEPSASPVVPAPIGSEQAQASSPQTSVRPPADFDLAAGLSSLRVGATTPEVEPVGPAASAIQPPSYPPFSPPQPTMNYGFQTAPAHLWSPPTAPSQLPHGLPAFGFPSPDTYGAAQLPSMGYYGAPAPPSHASAFMGLGLGIGGIGMGGQQQHGQPDHRSPTWSSAIHSPRMGPGAVGMARTPSGPSLGSTFGLLTSPYDSPYAATMMSSQLSSQSHDSRRSSQGMHYDPSYGGLTLSDHWGQMSPFASGMVGIPSLGGYGLQPGGQPSHYGLYGPTTPSAHAAAMYQASLNRPIRSAVLEDFRLNRHRRWEIEDLRDHICEFSQDQIGSRHVQQRLDTASITERQIVFDEIMPNLLTLSTDVFANYVCQKLIEVADPSQRGQLCNALEGHVLRLSLQMYGCRVIQKAIERAAAVNQRAIVRELDGHVLACARDQNANHVLQRVLERAPPDELSFIPRACEGQVFALATHPYGCRVLQRVLENLTDVRPLLDEVHECSSTLLSDQYGNYVVQYVLEKGTKADRAKVIAKVRNNLVTLAKHKFASNVIDKVVLCADDEERRALTDEILFDPTAVATMLRDSYANYPIQKFLLTVPAGPQRDLLLQRTAEALANLKRYSPTYSKHLMAIERWVLQPHLAAQEQAYENQAPHMIQPMMPVATV